MLAGKISGGETQMSDEKIINWMLVGASEINDVYRSIGADLLYRVVLPEYKHLVIAVEE